MKYRENNKPTRRDFIRDIILAAAAVPSASILSAVNGFAQENNKPLEVHVFSKALHFLDYERMAAFAAKVGFHGVDLTVRPGGHVLPEKVFKDLPKAIKAIKSAGLKSDMITTSIVDVRDLYAENILEVAADCGISSYRMGYFIYLKNKDIPSSIRHYQNQAKELSLLNNRLKIIGTYQNHSGDYVGASLWELWQVLEYADQASLGVQYDIRHAVVEGGGSWMNGLDLIKPKIKNIVIKDFKWAEVNGKWVVVDTPVGEGMVDFKAYFRMLKNYNLQLPISLHIEYPLGGAEHGAKKISVDEGIVFAAMKKDLDTIQKLWKDA